LTHAPGIAERHFVQRVFALPVLPLAAKPRSDPLAFRALPGHCRAVPSGDDPAVRINGIRWIEFRWLVHG
jgi:hypothetical protein